MFAKIYEDGEFCPRINGKCKKHPCKFWIHVRGRHPQTGEMMDTWDCADVLKVTLQIEACRLTDSVGAAVESARNENVKALGGVAAAIVSTQQAALPAREVSAIGVEE